MYQGELAAALFPVFVHVYIYLHQLDMPERAKRFLAANRTTHERLYHDELLQLASVVHRSQLVKVEFVRNMLVRHTTAPSDPPWLGSGFAVFIGPITI